MIFEMKPLSSYRCFFVPTDS